MTINESNIVAWTEALDELRRLAGAAEQTRIVPNLIVIDAAPAGLTGYIIVRSEQGVYSPVLKLPGFTYTNGDYVNVVYMKGTEPVAISQGSASSSSNTGRVDTVYAPNLTTPVMTTDAVLVAYFAGSVSIPQFLFRFGDPDTYIQFQNDRWDLYTGNTQMIAAIEDAQDTFDINPGQIDVDTTIGANGIDALSIDGATGVVSFGQPARAARIYNSAVQAITTAVNTKITFDTTRRDDGGLADLTNDRLTAVVAGWYIITAGFGFAANATGNRGGELMVNGTIEIAQQFYAAPATGVVVMAISAVYYLAAGDYVELFGFQTSGGNLNTHQVGNKDPELAMALLK